jgi:hypothetical protein
MCTCTQRSMLQQPASQRLWNSHTPCSHPADPALQSPSLGWEAGRPSQAPPRLGEAPPLHTQLPRLCAHAGHMAASSRGGSHGSTPHDWAQATPAAEAAGKSPRGFCPWLAPNIAMCCAAQVAMTSLAMLPLPDGNTATDWMLGKPWITNLHAPGLMPASQCALSLSDAHYAAQVAHAMHARPCIGTQAPLKDSTTPNPDTGALPNAPTTPTSPCC